MKYLLISAAMTLALGGAAYAQNDAGSAPATSMGGTAADSATSAPPAAAPAPATPMDSSSPAPAASTTASDTSATATVASDAPPASGDYPVCKTRTQDHCRVATHRHHAG